MSLRLPDGAAPSRRVRRGARAAARATEREVRADRARRRTRARPTEVIAKRLARQKRDLLTECGDLPTPPMPLLPPDLSRKLWIACQLLVTDTTAERLRWAARDMRDDGYGESAGAAWRAATVPLGDGTHRFSPRGTSEGSLRARRIFTANWALTQLERGGVVRGASVCVIMRLVRDVEDGDPYCDDCGWYHPSKSAWNHRGGDGTLETGDIGYVVALELAGAITRHQWRTPAQIARHCEPWEVGDSGYPTNEYWIVGRDAVGSEADSGNLPPALIVRYAYLRDQVDDVLNDDLPFVRSEYGSLAARRAVQRAQAPP